MTQYARSGEVWYGRFMPTLIKYFYPFADQVVAVSKGVSDNVTRMAPKTACKVRVVYNPIVDQKMLQKAKESVDHPWLNEKGPPVILGVGRLTRQKNFDLLLRSFASLREKRDARLIILGGGNQRESLEKRVDELDIGDHVDLHGFVRNPYPYMRRASLFVLSSDFEGFGSVIVEALACGCPVVSTDCPSGPREILGGGRWGRLVPVGDEVVLAEAMDEALSKPYDPDRLRQRARDFSVDAAVDNHLDVLFPDE
jgi:glycosyltransferase involved in cell wall biosynthesis